MDDHGNLIAIALYEQCMLLHLLCVARAQNFGSVMSMAVLHCWNSE